jgi:hypothetical protein
MHRLERWREELDGRFAANPGKAHKEKLTLSGIWEALHGRL